jgi:CheY-like chemotaxis protein
VEFQASCEQDTDEHVLITFTITDTGIGITKDHQSRLFKAFTQADTSITRKFGGTGLGLVISQSLAEKMGSHIHFDSESGQGSRFYLSLLLQTTGEEYLDEEITNLTLALDESADVAVLKASDLHILVVDDTKMNLNLMLALLKNIVPGARFSGASNGLEAVELYIKDTPNLVFMDVRMPEMDGLQATREIRSLEEASGNGRCVPIVAMSAAVYHEDIARCQQAGMDDFIGKPVDMKKIRELLGQYVSNGM